MSLHSQIVQRIIESIERDGVLPWRKPWGTRPPENALTGRRYRGCNRLLLSSAPYVDHRWLTFRQAAELGGRVMRGEVGTKIVYFGERVEYDEERHEVRAATFPRVFTVFNVQQVSGLSIPAFRAPEYDDGEDVASHAELLVRLMPDSPRLRKDGDAAYYVPSEDLIVMPPRESFDSGAAYASTLWHEAAHAVGHPRRLHRWEVGQTGRLASEEAYSREEVVAQLSSEFLMQEHGIATQERNSVAYVGGWLKTLKSDPRAIMSAASQAEQAADWIMRRYEP